MQSLSVESQYARDSSYVASGFGSIEITEQVAKSRGWHRLGRIANNALGESIAVGLKRRGSKHGNLERDRHRPFSPRLAEEIVVIGALQRSGEFDELLLPLFMALAVDEEGHEVGILTEDLSVDGQDGWQITHYCEVPVGKYNVADVLKGMKKALNSFGYGVYDHSLDNHALFEFGGRLAACDLEDVIFLDHGPAKTEYDRALEWVREGSLNVPVLITERNEVEAG